MNPIQRLHDAKLVVKTGAGIYRIFKLAPEDEVGEEHKFTGWNGSGDEKETTITLADRRGLLYFENDLWVFRVWDYMPGPGPDDFAFGYQNLDDAVQAVLDFYQGDATLIREWLVPLHRHPYLKRETVTRVIGDAHSIGATAFDALKQERSAQFAVDNPSGLADEGLSDRPQAIMSLQYIRCAPLHPRSPVLFLRRDAEEAYLVMPATSGENHRNA